MLVSIPALNDNYIWLYGRENQPVIVVDLPDFAPLLDYLNTHQLKVEAVLLTHKHADHVQGVGEFQQHFPDVPIYGSEECRAFGANHIVEQGKISTANYQIQVLPSGGHTEQHVSFLVDNHLFCGDALFSAGCGRVFTGNYAQMFESLQRFNQLPDDTLICPAHEYTLSNLAFAESVMEDKNTIKIHRTWVEQRRQENRPSLPTTLKLEKSINPFLQAKTLDEFIHLRQAKDKF